MEKWNFYVPTVTQAMRGKRELGAVGITAYIGRNTDMHRTEGCGYIIVVPEDGQRAATVLQKKSISITRHEVVR